MEILIKCIALAIMAMLLSVVVKKYAPEISPLLVILACTAVFIMSSELLKTIVSFIDALAKIAGINEELLSPVLKISAVAILARIGSDMCKENGISSVGSLIELCASGVSIVISIPLLEAVVELICGM